MVTKINKTLRPAQTPKNNKLIGDRQNAQQNVLTFPQRWASQNQQYTNNSNKQEKYTKENFFTHHQA